MRAVLLTSFADPTRALSVVDKPIPLLKPGTVLIRLAAASINPSDLVFLRDLYGIHKKLPVVPGFEGSGTVVSADAGLYGRWLVGKNVACHASEEGDGTWAEYMLASPDHCIPLRGRVSLEQGASFIVNPLTAWCLIEIARRAKQRAIVQTAAAGALGRMIDRLGRRIGLRVINVVRKPEQVDKLKNQGVPSVFCSADPSFVEALTTECRRLGAAMAFDAVGGDALVHILRALPDGGNVVTYGALSGQSAALSPSEFIFHGKTVTGFWLTEHLKRLSFAAKAWMSYRVQGLLHQELSTEIQARYPIERVAEAIAAYKQNRSIGKVLISFDGSK